MPDHDCSALQIPADTRSSQSGPSLLRGEEFFFQNLVMRRSDYGSTHWTCDARGTAARAVSERVLVPLGSILSRKALESALRAET